LETDGYGCTVKPVKPPKPARAKPTDNAADESDAGAFKFRD